jgi:hypothetical protein
VQHVYEVRPRKDHRGFDLISDALPFGRLWHGALYKVRSRKSNNAVTFAVQRWAEIGAILCHQKANIRMNTKGNRYEYRSEFDQT